MSDALNEETLLVRIRRDRAESEKLMAERDKLFREADKLRLDRWLALIALGGLLVGALGLLVALATR
jgi:hypothetical protein